MGLYMTQARFTSTTWRHMTKSPSDRRRAVEKLMKAHGGKLLHFYWSFGDHDVVAIYQTPDHRAALAALMTIAAGGAVTETRTTVLIENADAMKAMGKAGSTKSGYSVPGRLAGRAKDG